MTGVVPSPAVSEKALRLLEQRRVSLYWNGDVPHALVSGDTDRHTVTSYLHGVHCDCLAGSNLDTVSCTHKVAAQIAWFES